jgi:phosphoglycolate phosphatase
MQRYELIVFDWDGTLMDSAGMIVIAYRQPRAPNIELPSMNVRVTSSAGLVDALPCLARSAEARYGSGDVIAIIIVSRQNWFCFPARIRWCKLPRTVGWLWRPANGAGWIVRWSTVLGSYFHATRCADECHSATRRCWRS